MPTVRMYIDKFQREVLIDSEHPLALMQKAKQQGTSFVASTMPVSSVPAVETPLKVSRGASRSKSVR